MDSNAEVLKSIKELILVAPDNWADLVAAKMGKSPASVWYYVRGKRGIKKGYHKDVLMFLTEVINDDRKDTLMLIAKAQVAKGITDEDEIQDI